MLFATAIHQLRYAAGLMRGRAVPVASLSRLARDLVATIAEFGEPGEDSQLIPGQQGVPDPDVRRTMTTRSLRLTARRAARHTAYYRRVFAGDGPALEDLTPDTWTRVPVTPKAALREAPGAFVAEGVEPAVLALTTGTSGRPTAVWYSRREIQMLVALNVISGALARRLRPGHVVAYAGSSRATIPMLCVSEGTRGTGAAFVQLGAVDPEIVLDRLATPIDLPGGTRWISHLTANTSYLGALVSAAERHGKQPDDFGLVAIQVGGEILSDGLRERARRVFGVPVDIGYGLTEALPAGAMRCRAGHLHHTAEFAHVEVVDPVTYRPSRPGEIGVLVVTPFVPYRECTLLLRYLTGDLVRRLAEPAACELAAIPATSDVLGRHTGPLSIRVPHRDVLEVLDSEPAVPLPARFAVTDDPAGPLLHVLVDRPTAALRDRLEETAAARAVPIGGIVLHADRATLPAHPPPRSDLREHTFERKDAVPAAPVAAWSAS